MRDCRAHHDDHYHDHDHHDHHDHYYPPGLLESFQLQRPPLLP
jgi:hypothetical protein